MEESHVDAWVSREVIVWSTRGHRAATLLQLIVDLLTEVYITKAWRYILGTRGLIKGIDKVGATGELDRRHWIGKIFAHMVLCGLQVG